MRLILINSRLPNTRPLRRRTPELPPQSFIFPFINSCWRRVFCLSVLTRTRPMSATGHPLCSGLRVLCTTPTDTLTGTAISRIDWPSARRARTTRRLSSSTVGGGSCGCGAVSSGVVEDVGVLSVSAARVEVLSGERDFPVAGLVFFVGVLFRRSEDLAPAGPVLLGDPHPSCQPVIARVGYPPSAPSCPWRW